MLNQAAVEALYSASYVEDYLDCIENLPDDIQRHISQLREFDQKHQEILQELDQYQNALQKDLDAVNRKRILLQIQRALICSQELGDDKIEILQQIQDLIENKTRQLDTDYKNLDFGRDHENHIETNRTETQPERASKRSRRQRNHDSFLRDDLLHERHHEKESTLSTISSLAGSSNSLPASNAVTSGSLNTTNINNSSNTSGKKKKKKRKTKADRGRETSPIDPPIDPNEPTYCLCEQVSFGEMIGCDNDECPIEWFHFSCVGLTTKPKGKWYCPKCRGDRSNQMKQKT